MCPHPRGVTMTHLDLSWVVVALAVIALAVAIIILAKRVRSLESKVPQPIYNMTLHVTEGTEVDENAPLATLERRPLELKHAAATARLNVAKERLRLLQAGEREEGQQEHTNGFAR